MTINNLMAQSDIIETYIVCMVESYQTAALEFTGEEIQERCDRTDRICLDTLKAMTGEFMAQRWYQRYEGLKENKNI